MKILAIDIETTPTVAYTWGLWDQNVGLNQIVEPTRMLCFAAKWLGSDEVKFFSAWDKRDQKKMVRAAHKLLSEADVVLHYNGARFDVTHLNREFLLQKLGPPAPYKQVDLLRVAKKQFRFLSNKLEHVSRQVGLAGKVGHEGFELWRKCMDGDKDARARMEVYNIQDVELLDDLYHELLPWIPNHPSVAAFSGEEVCPACGGENLKREGYSYTQLGRYQRFQCRDCSKWSRSGKRLDGVSVREVALG